MNWFMAAIGIQYLGAMSLEIKRKNWMLVIVYLCYGISAIALGMLKLHK